MVGRIDNNFTFYCMLFIMRFIFIIIKKIYFIKVFSFFKEKDFNYV